MTTDTETLLELIDSAEIDSQIYGRIPHQTAEELLTRMGGSPITYDSAGFAAYYCLLLTKKVLELEAEIKELKGEHHVR